MKKVFLLLTAVLVMSGSMFAQNFDFCIGPKFGYQTAKLSYQKADIKAGFAEHFTIGVFGRVEIGNLYVQPEILWFKTADAFDMSIDTTHASIAGLEFPNSGRFTMTRNAMNIQVPVLIGYKLNLLDKLALRAQVGPTANFIIPAKTVVDKTVGDSGNLPQELEDTEFDTKSIAWGFQMGLGVDFFRFTLDINYNLGISKVFGANVINNYTEWGQYIDTENIDQTKQNMFMVTVGYKFL